MNGLVYKSAPKTLTSALALTDTLAASEPIDTSNDSYVTFAIDYTKGGDATLLELVAEFDVGGTWYPETAANSGTPSGGAVNVEAVAVTRTITATGLRTITLPCYGASRARVKVRETGTPGGTVTVTGVAARVGG